ncbi:hypothetical protein ACIGZJ_35980 [Kitasatospora sp. NPDC052868]|uniref:hypothetical protein n=1 Tax=Kitasatospora sp. NPDC052868 TaxID=3364060 RepID=UPI0037C515FD
MVTETKGREGTRIITALERVWAQIQRHHPEVPDCVMITGSGLTGRKGRGGQPAGMKRGHHSADKWVEPGGRAPEIFVAGELLALGGREVLQTLLHEAAHAVGARRGIKTTSSQGNRWHNRRFAELAKELGLEPPKRAQPVLGFSFCVVTDATLARYARAVQGFDGAQLPFLEAGAGGAAGGVDAPKEKKPPAEKTGGKRVKVLCGCEPPRTLQLTPKSLSDGAVLCGLCHEAFAPDPADGPVPGEGAEGDPAGG